MSKCWFDLLCGELSLRAQGGKDLVRIQLGHGMHNNSAALKHLLHLTVCSDEHSECKIVCFFTVAIPWKKNSCQVASALGSFNHVITTASQSFKEKLQLKKPHLRSHTQQYGTKFSLTCPLGYDTDWKIMEDLSTLYFEGEINAYFSLFPRLNEPNLTKVLCLLKWKEILSFLFYRLICC